MLRKGNLLLLIIKEEIVSAISDNGFNVGEQDASELKECLLEPSTRNVQQIIVDDYNKADELFNIFMGSAVEQRRDWILTHSDQANDI